MCVFDPYFKLNPIFNMHALLGTEYAARQAISKMLFSFFIIIRSFFVITDSVLQDILLNPLRQPGCLSIADM